MSERMVLDLLGLLAKRVEFRESLARGEPSADEAGPRVAERPLEVACPRARRRRFP